MDWLAYRLAQLSGRERALLLALVVVAVPLAIAFGLAAPLIEARADARRAAAEAEALRDWVAARVAELPPEGLQEERPETATPDPIGLSGLEQGIVSAGLRGQLSRLEARTDGGVDLEFDAVEFDALIGWLHDTAPNWGYAIAAYRIERGDPGLASAAFTLEPGP